MSKFGTAKEDFLSLVSFPLLWLEITEGRKCFLFLFFSFSAKQWGLLLPQDTHPAWEPSSFSLLSRSPRLTAPTLDFCSPQSAKVSFITEKMKVPLPQILGNVLWACIPQPLLTWGSSLQDVIYALLIRLQSASFYFHETSAVPPAERNVSGIKTWECSTQVLRLPVAGGALSARA